MPPYSTQSQRPLRTVMLRTRPSCDAPTASSVRTCFPSRVTSTWSPSMATFDNWCILSRGRPNQPEGRRRLATSCSAKKASMASTMGDGLREDGTQPSSPTTRRTEAGNAPSARNEFTDLPRYGCQPRAASSSARSTPMRWDTSCQASSGDLQRSSSMVATSSVTCPTVDAWGSRVISNASSTGRCQ